MNFASYISVNKMLRPAILLLLPLLLFQTPPSTLADYLTEEHVDMSFVDIWVENSDESVSSGYPVAEGAEVHIGCKVKENWNDTHYPKAAVLDVQINGEDAAKFKEVSHEQFLHIHVELFFFGQFVMFLRHSCSVIVSQIF